MLNVRTLAGCLESNSFIFIFPKKRIILRIQCLQTDWVFKWFGIFFLYVEKIQIKSLKINFFEP